MVRSVLSLTFLLAVASALILFGASPATAADPVKVVRKVVVAVPPDFPPTYSRDENTGKPKGFAIDVMNEVAQRAGLEVEYVFGRPWDDLLGMLQSGKADLIPNLTIDEARRTKFLFTLPVETVLANLIVRKDDRKASVLVSGMKVGVMKGSISYDNLKSRTDLRLETYESLQHLVFDLLAGHVDMISAPTPNVMKLAVDAGVDDRLEVLTPPLRESKRAMALRQGDTELQKRLNEAIDSFVGSDKYKEIYARWWGKPKPYWTTSRVMTLAGSVFLATLFAMVYWRYRSLSRLNSYLRRSEKKYRELFNGVTDAIFVWEPDKVGGFGRLLEVNGTACTFSGCTRKELLNMKSDEFSFHSLIDMLHTAKVLVSGEEGTVSETSFAHPDGTTIPLEVSSHQFELDGRMVVISIARDISARISAEESSRENALFIQTLLEHAPVGIRVFDGVSGECLLANQTTAAIAGGDVIAVQGQNFRELESWKECGLTDSTDTPLWVRAISTSKASAGEAPNLDTQ